MTGDLLQAPLLCVTGNVLSARVEQSHNPRFVDHVWITLNTGGDPHWLVSINTLSTRNREAGFDPRVRVGMVRETAEYAPPRGVKRLTSFDYALIEERHNVYYEHYERSALEILLQEMAWGCDLMEAWGAPYHRRVHPGLHQIHSRRASCAVAEDIIGLDGAMRFHFRSRKESTLLLLKFCGQP